jgi:hypothetical protein
MATLSELVAQYKGTASKRPPVDLGGNASLEKAKANQAAEGVTKDDYAAATAPELNGYDAYVASAIGGASRTLSGKRGGGAKYNEGRFKGKTKFEAMAILDKEYREMGDEGRAAWEQRQNTPLSQSQMDIRAKAADARNRIAVTGLGQSEGSAPNSANAPGSPMRPATPGGQTPTTAPNPAAPSPLPDGARPQSTGPVQGAVAQDGPSGLNGARQQSTGGIQGARGLGSVSGVQGAGPLNASPLLPADRPAAPPSWEGKNAASTFRARAQTAMAMGVIGPQSTYNGSGSKPQTETATPAGAMNVRRNDGMTRADRKIAVSGPPAKATTNVMGDRPTQGPKLPTFDRAAATAKAQGEVASMFANARATVPAPRTDVKAPPLPEPTQAVRDAAKAFAKREANRIYIEHPLMQSPKTALLGRPSDVEYKPTSFIDSPEYKAAQSAPAPQIAARPPSSRVGKDAPAPPTVDSMVQKVMGKPRTPTEFTPVARTGGRAGATKRVAATPSPVRAAASKALASR